MDAEPHWIYSPREIFRRNHALQSDELPVLRCGVLKTVKSVV